MNYTQHANILIQALPYIQEYYSKTIVIKYGGNAMISEELQESVINDIVLMLRDREEAQWLQGLP